MKSFLLLIILNVLIASNAIGQCTIRGKVSDLNGETLIGATVYPKSKMSSGISADVTGDFSLKLPESGTEIIVISFVGYKTIEDTIHCSKGVIIKNYIMESSIKSISAAVITAKASRGSEAQLERVKIKSSSTIDFISADTIQLFGARMGL